MSSSSSSSSPLYCLRENISFDTLIRRSSRGHNSRKATQPSHCGTCLILLIFIAKRVQPSLPSSTLRSNFVYPRQISRSPRVRRVVTLASLCLPAAHFYSVRRHCFCCSCSYRIPLFMDEACSRVKNLVQSTTSSPCRWKVVLRFTIAAKTALKSQRRVVYLVLEFAMTFPLFCPKAK